MALSIYEPPEDEEKPELRIYPKEEEETERPVLPEYIAKQRMKYQQLPLVSPWDPADTL